MSEFVGIWIFLINQERITKYRCRVLECDAMLPKVFRSLSFIPFKFHT